MAVIRIVREIASALVAESVASNKLVDVMSSVDVVAHLFDAHPEMRAALADRSTHKTKRIRAVDQAFSGIHPFMVNALKLLIEHGVLGSFAVFRDVAWNESERLGHRRVSVRTAKTLSVEDRHAIECEVLQRVGGTVSLHEDIDPALIGGIIVTADGWKYDASVAGQIRKLTHILTN